MQSRWFQVNFHRVIVRLCWGPGQLSALSLRRNKYLVPATLNLEVGEGDDIKERLRVMTAIA